MNKELSREEIDQELAECLADPVYFLKLFLPDWFPDTIPWFHRGILAILTRQTDFLVKYGELDKIIANFEWKEDPWDQQSPPQPMFSLQPDGTIKLVITRFTVLMLPRGFSKTTLLNGIGLYLTLFQLRKFLVYISESSTHAQMQLQNVQRELESNSTVKGIFGTLRPNQGDAARWTNEFFETLTGVAFAAKGRGSQVRGMNLRGVRPEVILLDDVEDRESVRTDEQREKTRQWFYRDVMPALPPRDPSATIVVLGTLLHSDSLLVTLSRDPQFNTVIFGATAKDGSPLWPEHFGSDKLAVKKRAAGLAGDLSGFYMEYFNQVRNLESAKFRQENFHYEPAPPRDELMVALAIDPAISENADACDCVLAVAGMHIKSGKIWVLDLIGGKGMSMQEQSKHYFDLHRKWKPEKHGVESVAYQRALIHYMREQMFREKSYFEIEPIKNAGNLSKDDRINGILQGRYASGYMRHARRFPKLETELLDFPNGGKDYPDALSMAIGLLDPYAAAAADPTIDLGDDEYEPLEVALGLKKGKQWRPH